MIADVLVPLIAVGLAELGDKTQLSILLLSSRTHNHLQLLLGVTFAFFVVNGISVWIGSWITNVVPLHWIKIFSGMLFILFGIFTLREAYKKNDDGVKKERRFHFNNMFLSGFLLIFLTEWGDKTQLASTLFATQYNPVQVLIGTMIALLFVSIIAIYLGKIISRKIDRTLISKIAGIIFIIIGITLFL